MDIKKLDISSLKAGQILKEMSLSAGINFIDPMEYFCAETKCKRWDEKTGWLYVDWNHLSLAGADYLAPGFRKFLNNL